jgi:hypothetical protein
VRYGHKHGFNSRDADDAAPRAQHTDLSHDFLPALNRSLRDLLVDQGFECPDQLLQLHQARQFGDRRDLKAFRHGEELRVGAVPGPAQNPAWIGSPSDLRKLSISAVSR